jgi:hypothetical protein
MKIIAAVAAGLLAVVAVHQLALAAGAPWAAAAYGGRAARDDGTLPAGYRAMSAVTSVVLLGAAWLVLAAGGVITSGPLSHRALTIGAWVLAGLFALNTLGNASARHPVERWGFGAVTAVLTVLFAVVALA